MYVGLCELYDEFLLSHFITIDNFVGKMLYNACKSLVVMFLSVLFLLDEFLNVIEQKIILISMNFL